MLLKYRDVIVEKVSAIVESLAGGDEEGGAVAGPNILQVRANRSSFCCALRCYSSTINISLFLQITLASVILNYGIVLLSDPDQEASVQIVSLLGTVMLTSLTAEEALYRTLVSLGTLVSGDEQSRDLALALDVKQGIGRMITEGKEGKVRECAREIMEVLDKEF